MQRRADIGAAEKGLFSAGKFLFLKDRGNGKILRLEQPFCFRFYEFRGKMNIYSGLFGECQSVSCPIHAFAC